MFRCWRASERASDCPAPPLAPLGMLISPWACELIWPWRCAISCICWIISEKPDALFALFARSRSRASDAAAFVSASAASPSAPACCADRGDAWPFCDETLCVACATLACASETARAERGERSALFRPAFCSRSLAFATPCSTALCAARWSSPCDPERACCSSARS